MAVAHVQSDWDIKGTTSTTHVYASGLTVTSANLIAVFIKYRGNGTITATVTDNFSNTYTQSPGGYIDGGDDSVGMNRGAMFYAKNITGGANYTITVTYSASVTTGQGVLAFHEVSGCDTAAPLVADDGNAQAAPGTGADAITSTAQTPSASNAYVFGAFSGGQGGTTVTVGTGFTAGVNIGTISSTFHISTEYQIQGAASSVAATFTDNFSLSNTIAMLMAFQPVVVGGGGTDGWKILLN